MRILFNGEIYYITAKIKLFLIVLGIILFICSCLGYKALRSPDISFGLLLIIISLLIYLITFWISMDGCDDDLYDYDGNEFSFSIFLWAIFIAVLLISALFFRLIFDFFYWCFT
jgi:hypothetical protein